MSFDPLPMPLQKALDRSPAGRAVELGCGDGHFTRILAGRRSWVVGLDRSRPLEPDFPFVVGDAARPPLRPGAWDTVVVPNLLRHLPAEALAGELWYAWFDLLADDGALYVLEDEPATDPGPAGHYARLQALLAELPGRGPLLPLAEFRRRCQRGPARIVAYGLEPNRYPLDADAVVSLLASGAPAPGGEAAALAADIGRDGIAPGLCWWARIEQRSTA